MRRVFLCVLVLAVLLCACSEQQQNTMSGNTAPPTASEGGRLSIGVYNFDTYNPVVTQSQSVVQACALIYDGLMKRKSDGTADLCLAENYSVSASGLVYTFNLRNDVLWHDGSGFDAQDVDYTIEMINKVSYSSYKNRFSNVEETRRADKYTYVITLKEANAGFINLMDFPIIKKDTDCVNGLKEYVPIGTGAYKYVPSAEGRSMLLARNEDYTAGAKPYINEMVIKELRDKNTLTTTLEVKEIGAAPFTAQELMSYNPKGNLYTISYSNNDLLFLGINTNAAALSDAAVRRALSYSAGREGIKKDVMFGHAESVFVPASPGSAMFKEIYRLEESNTRAAELLAEAGYTAGEDGAVKKAGAGELKFELLVNEENERRTAAAYKLKDSWSQIGAEVSVVSLPFAEYKARINAGNYDMFLGEVKIGADFDLSAFAGAGAQYSVYTDERLETLLKSCKTASSQEGFIKTYMEIEEVIMEEAPIIPLLMGTDALIVSSDIAGVTAPAEGNVFSDISGWYFIKTQ